MNIDLNLLRIAVTVIGFITFIGILVWAYSQRNKADFEKAALLPFNEETIKS
ncbi:MAG: cbb3-type cytochrome c oxidase subunit 3 [Burkholderiaceae bacterium]|nr:cbb3-type cytochrome c oxidase subunit 3 [Burkholderiaceae bacterium]